jgi:dTDP-4-dehydrorhamnose reductase
MNILVTGSRGQLGSELRTISVQYKGLHFFFYDLPELDITRRDQVDRACLEHGIEVIVNCAAYTAVDRAESDVDAAFMVNRDGVAVLAECARDRQALLVHISTDYVFNGESSVPYRETDVANPIGVYGISKWEGEERIRQIAPSHIIIRTSWLYSGFGNNFVKSMLRLGADKRMLNVVFDQVGTPTYASDLASAIVSIIEKHDQHNNYAETYHYSNEGVCSWYDFACAIMKTRNLQCRVLPIDSNEYPTLARRPHFSVLHKAKIKADWGLDIPHWYDGLERMLTHC